MHDTSSKYLLQIEPKSKCLDEPINDELTLKMEALLCIAKKEATFRGFHRCVCGATSGNSDLKVDKYITNTLAPHYLRWHRDEVPISEIQKLKSIDIEQKEDKK